MTLTVKARKKTFFSNFGEITAKNPIGRTGIVGLGDLLKPGANKVDILVVFLNNPRKVLMELAKKPEGVEDDLLQLGCPRRF